MSKQENASMSVIRRLPRYYRFPTHLKKMGMIRISSKELSRKMGLIAFQIHRDLNCSGGFGQQGYGYIADQLQREIRGIFGLSNSYKTISIGVGNLGQILALHMASTTQESQLVGIFDSSPSKISIEINGVTTTDTQHLKEFCRAEQLAMTILYTLRESAGKLPEQLYSPGIHSFWNFSHFDISMKCPDAVAKNAHLNDSLVTLCYRISDHQEEKNASSDTAVQE